MSIPLPGLWSRRLPPHTSETTCGTTCLRITFLSRVSLVECLAKLGISSTLEGSQDALGYSSSTAEDLVQTPRTDLAKLAVPA
jgi:hypothetical protein